MEISNYEVSQLLRFILKVYTREKFNLMIRLRDEMRLANRPPSEIYRVILRSIYLDEWEQIESRN